jgi:hypothetical protein
LEPDYEFEEIWADILGVAEPLVEMMAKPPAREMTEPPAEPSSSTKRTKKREEGRGNMV